jgi:Kef-type K+ transport system membrane component KefB
VLAVALVLTGATRSMRISATLVRLQDTTAQIRVRGAFLILAGFVFLAERFGLEAILGAFLAGATLKLVDRDRAMTHPQFHRKLEAVGFGVFIPSFFVASGLTFDGGPLFDSASTLARVPLFLGALLVVRGVPAVLYGRILARRETFAAGLLQATSLSFLVVASQIGTELGLLSRANAAAVIAAGLLSVVIFPVVALGLISPSARIGTRSEAPAQPPG